MTTANAHPPVDSSGSSTAEYAHWASSEYMLDDRPITAGEGRGPGCAKRDAIIVGDSISRTYGAIKAVNVDHIEVPRHKITALIGPNGAGKTTLFNLLTCFDTPQSGKWSFDGHALSGMAPFKIAKLGMVRTFQLTKVLGKLTVIENMRLGGSRQPGEKLYTALFPWLWRKREAEITKKADELLARFKLDDKREDYAASMSGGQRKLLEMARSLMTEPVLVMLDEPMAGVNPALKQSLLDHIVNLKAEGMTVLFVEHDMHMVRHIADWVIVMAEGRIVAEGPPSEVMADQAVIDAYLGAHHDVDLGDAAGVAELERELANDAESVIGTEDAGMLDAELLLGAPQVRDAGLPEESGPAPDNDPHDGPEQTGPGRREGDAR